MGSQPQQEDSDFSNRDLIARFNLLQRVKRHYTVPKIKLAFNRNMSRIQRALEPFNEATQELRQQFEIPENAEIHDQNGNQREEIDGKFYEKRKEYLKANSEPYDPYTVPESLLDNEPGQMPDGRAGIPEGALMPVMWMFEE